MPCDSVRFSALILLVVLVFVAGCVDEIPAADRGAIIDSPAIAEMAEHEDADQALPRRVAFEEVPLLPVEATWALSFSRNFRFSLAADGMITASAERARDGRYVVRTCGASGDIIWTYTTSRRHFVSADLRVLGDQPLVGLALYRTDGGGSLRILDGDGRLAYERSLQGATCFSLCHRGETLALLDRLSGEMVIVELETGRDLGSIQAGPEDLFGFIPETELLLLKSREGVQILTRTATSLWHQGLKIDLRGGIGVTDGGNRIALTTLDPDSALYMFDQSEGLLWQQLLFPGGYNDLHLSADGSSLLVYNVGVEGGIFLHDMDSGDPVWRYFIHLDGEDEGNLRIHDVAVDGRGRVTAHLAVSENSDSGVAESHYLLFVSPSGEVTGRVLLGVNVQVQLAQNAQAVAVASGEHRGSTGARVLDTLTYYDLASISTTP